MANNYELLVEPRLEEIKEWAKESTDKEIAAALNISYSSFKGYKKKHAALAGALVSARAEPDYEVLGAFHRKATGCEIKEVVKERVNGKLVVVKEVTKEVPPDTEAGKFWLKNRMPDSWRDKQQLEHSGEIRTEKLDDILSQLGGEGLEE